MADPAPTSTGAPRPSGSLAQALQDRLGDFSPAERKVARVLLAGWPAAGLQPAARLAAEVGVSAPTVLRLATRLGFSGYPDMQRALRAELDARRASPLTLLQDASAPGASDAAALLHRAGGVLAEDVRATLEALPAADLEHAVALLADERRRVLIAGGRFSHLLGHFLLLHLTQMRDGVVLLPREPVERAATLAGPGRDVLVALDFRRYETATRAVAEHVRARRGSVVLFTDRWLSPVAGVADVVLPSRVDAPSPYDSLVATVALVEVLVAGVLAALGPRAQERMAACEQAARATHGLDAEAGSPLGDQAG